MNSILRTLTAAMCAAAAAFCFVSCKHEVKPANTLVILHTNDTHSQIDPTDKNLGGVMRRAAVIDSIRDANKNVLVVDAGDVVQGTLYFYLYGGEVEQEVLNILGVQEGILGNHEFDNGMDSLATILRMRESNMLSANYIIEGTPLEGMLMPYSVREYDGKKIGIMGINLDPEGIIKEEYYHGLEFLPIVATANATAERLKNEEGVDAVIALTHIGYHPGELPGDSVLAVNSRNIDVIIGGHSHDVIDPHTAQGAARSRMTNLEGREVLVVQTGKSGVNLGKIEINLDSLGLGGRPTYELIPINNRYDGYVNARLQAVIDKYQPGVDSLMHRWIGTTAQALPDTSVRMLNFFSDFVMEEGRKLAPGIDLAIANKGALRTSLPEGQFSEGHIINMIPFRNYITVVDVSGSDLLDIFEVMANTQGNGVSANVRASYRRQGETTVLADATINGRPIDPSRTYRVATLDYLAAGGDYMKGFQNGTKVADSDTWIYNAMLDYFTIGKGHGVPLTGSPEPRWTEVTATESR